MRSKRGKECDRKGRKKERVQEPAKCKIERRK